MASTNVVKCNNCNLVINEILSFIQNKIDITDEVSLVAICTSAFSTEDLEKAKSLLFDSISEPKKQRRGKKKNESDIQDIISLLKSTDVEKVPIFVAKDLQKLPPVTFDHVDVTRLLKDILTMQKDMTQIQNNCEKYLKESVSIKEFEDLRSEVEMIRNHQLDLKKIIEAPTSEEISSLPHAHVNTVRGSCFGRYNNEDCDSGPMGLLNFNEATSASTGMTSEQRSPSYAQVISESVPLAPKASSVEPVRKERAKATAVTSTLQEVSRPTTPKESATTHSFGGGSEKVSELDAAVAGTEVSATPPPPMTRPLQQVLLLPTWMTNNSVPNLSNSKISDSRVSINTKCDVQMISSVPLSNNYASVLQSNRNKVTHLKYDVLNAKNSYNKKPRWFKEHESELRYKRQSRFIGKQGTARANTSNFKAADITVPLYLYNVSRETTQEDIADYIYSKSGVTVMPEKVDSKLDKEYNSYKLNIPKHKLYLLNKDDFWPEGVYFRKYFTLKRDNE